MVRHVLAALMMRRAFLSVTFAVLGVLLGHDALMAAQGTLPEPHHVAVASGTLSTSPASHDAPAPHPETCDPALRALPQPTGAPPPVALPCVLPARHAAAVLRARPLRLNVLSASPPATRRAMLQVYRL
ncbi:MAG: hypothetical protein JNM64_15320 [Chloroflexia bacterium]|nr:hypothetical protein [Chloroflexia bacterium]